VSGFRPHSIKSTIPVFDFLEKRIIFAKRNAKMRAIMESITLKYNESNTPRWA